MRCRDGPTFFVALLLKELWAVPQCNFCQKEVWIFPRRSFVRPSFISEV